MVSMTFNFKCDDICHSSVPSIFNTLMLQVICHIDYNLNLIFLKYWKYRGERIGSKNSKNNFSLVLRFQKLSNIDYSSGTKI